MLKYLVWLRGLATVSVPYIVEAESRDDAIEQQQQGDGDYYDALMDWSFDTHCEIERTAEPYEEEPEGK